MGNVIPLRRPPQSRRRSERLGLTQPVALVDAYGTVATGRSVDISLGGMQIVCDRLTVDSLHLSDSQPAPENEIRLDVHFGLPLASGLAKLDAECRLVYVVPGEPLSDFLMGLQFVRFHYAGAQLVERFLREAELLQIS